jgi:nicotinamidase-related amidase
MKTALILVDIQNDYFPGGKNALEGSPQASMKAKELLEYFRSQHLPLVHIQHVSIRAGATFFLPGTEGVRHHVDVEPLAGETVFEKHLPNSFRDTPLLEHLHTLQIRRVVISGMMTHMCVDATVRAAFDHGFECWVTQDGCATKALTFDDQSVAAAQVHLAFLAALRGTYGKVMTAQEILAALKAEASEFTKMDDAVMSAG